METLRLGQGNAAITRRASADPARSKLDATGTGIGNPLNNKCNGFTGHSGDFSRLRVMAHRMRQSGRNRGKRRKRPLFMGAQKTAMGDFTPKCMNRSGS